MRYIFIFLLLLSFSSSFAQVNSNDIFLQEVATVYTPDDGLPEAIFSDIQLYKSGKVIAVSEKGTFIYDGGKWESSSNLSSDILKGKKDTDENILVNIEYQQKIYIGRKDGLFIQGKEKNKWIEIFPADNNYSWKLSNVNVLKADSKGRLWFGSNEGVGYFHNDQWKLFTGKEGLPFKYFTCIANAPDGQIWFGTKKGAIRVDGEKFYYRFSRR